MASNREDRGRGWEGAAWGERCASVSQVHGVFREWSHGGQGHSECMGSLLYFCPCCSSPAPTESALRLAIQPLSKAGARQDWLPGHLGSIRRAGRLSVPWGSHRGNNDDIHSRESRRGYRPKEQLSAHQGTDTKPTGVASGLNGPEFKSQMGPVFLSQGTGLEV